MLSRSRRQDGALKGRPTEQEKTKVLQFHPENRPSMPVTYIPRWSPADHLGVGGGTPLLSVSFGRGPAWIGLIEEDINVPLTRNVSASHETTLDLHPHFMSQQN